MLLMIMKELGRVEGCVVVDSNICYDLRLRKRNISARRAKFGLNQQKMTIKDTLADLQIVKIDVALIAFVVHLFGYVTPVFLFMLKLK